jgi:small subunit ribosomal protein S17
MSTQIISKRTLKGTVISAAGDKTIVVSVERRVKHPMYSKFVSRTKKYHAHDEKNVATKGDAVTIIESRPHSKLKKWELFSK